MLSKSTDRNMPADRDPADGPSQKVEPSQSSTCSLALKGGLLAAIAAMGAVLAWQITAITKIIAPAVAAPVLCGPGLLHTMSEPPEI